MPEVHGNIEGIRKTLINELAQLYDELIEPDVFVPQSLLERLCGCSASINREVAVYITRYGEVADVFIGKNDHIDLPDLRLRRSDKRLSQIRCIHTHPNATGQLSGVDLSALTSMKFDAMCAVGVKEDGRPTSVQCAFLDPFVADGTVLTEIMSVYRLPQAEWMGKIEETDAAFSPAKTEEIVSDKEKAVLVGIESEESLNELQELAETAGAETIMKVLQKRDKPDSVFCVGRGKAEELSLLCQSIRADTVIFDEELTGVMQKNLEELLRVKVVDRTTLILDIFAARAKTKEGKLQVEMAQLQYRSQRLLGQGLILSRLAGGIGTRGPGESKLEVNRRRIRDRLTDLRRETEQLEKNRTLRRKSRTKNGVPVVALVGYTNAGKSTLFNRLTDSDVYVMDQLFATLDSTSRPVTLPHGGNAILVDTVGFIRKLPHDLVKAFHSTLEEAVLADVLVLVTDGSDPKMNEHHDTVEEVLDGLGATDAPRIEVLNKCDLFEDQPDQMPGAIRISAASGLNTDKLLTAIEEKLDKGLNEYRLLIPFDRFGLLNRLQTLGTVVSQDYTDGGVCITYRAKDSSVRFACREGASLIE